MVGFIVLVAIIAGVLILNKKIKVNKLPVPSATPSIQQKIESKFQGLKVPSGEASIELKDVSGKGGMGVATKSEIMADLPDLGEGQLYQGWLENSSGKTVLLGNLKMAKGGWILDYSSSKYPGYNKIIVTQGTAHILEGSF